MDNKVYKVKISSVDKETGNETVEGDLTLSNVFLLCNSSEDKTRFTSLIMDSSAMAIAMMLASSEKTRPIVRLANVMVDLLKEDVACVEDALLREIMKG